MNRPVDLAALLDGGAWTPHQKLLTALTALAVIFDGFDIQILAFAIPALIKDWDVTRADFGPVLAIGLAGMALGGPLAGYVGDRFGRRPALIGSVALFGLATACTALADGVVALAVMRFITGIGAGGAVPNAGALAAEFAPLRSRPAAVKLTIVCIPLGGMLGGLIAARVLPAFGWRALYLLGGALPLVFSLALWWMLPESPRFLARRPNRWPQLQRLLERMGHRVPEGSTFEDHAEPRGAGRVSIAELFAHGLARNSAGLWVAFFFSMASIYLVFGWLPTMLTAQGLSAAAAISNLSLYNFGGVLGVLLWTVLMARWGSRGPLLMGSLATAASAVALVQIPVQSAWFVTALVLNGLLGNAVQTSMYALGAHVYPTSVRASGVAYAAAVGRVGALFSSFYGAAIIQAGAQTYWLALALAMVVTFAGLSLVRRHFTASGASTQ